jgi:decaprenylphospho-beta-D-erythro-pentofuranosid-2-ulose 2-reductase
MNQPVGHGSGVLILGATSAIAEALARRLAARGVRLALVARDSHKLAAIQTDLQVRHGPQAVVFTARADLDLLADHAPLVAAAAQALGRIDVAVLAHGSLPEQAACEADVALALAQLHTNGVSAVSLCGHLANLLQAQASGRLVVITSVAGDRGRPSNYVYGSAKGLVSRYLQGLRARLWRHGVAVIDLRPGFVITPMTAGFDRNGPLWVSADRIAVGALAAIDAQREVAYLPGFWRVIMAVICAIPEKLFKRLSL